MLRHGLLVVKVRLRKEENISSNSFFFLQQTETFHKDYIKACVSCFVSVSRMLAHP